MTSFGRKLLVIGLIFLNIALMVICGFFYMQKDRQKPGISFSANDVVYTRDMDQNLLMEGVSATDNKDGNITNRIVIEKILENEKKSTAVVYYAVCDYSGNVNKASREFVAEYPAKEEDSEKTN